MKNRLRSNRVPLSTNLLYISIARRAVVKIRSGDSLKRVYAGPYLTHMRSKSLAGAELLAQTSSACLSEGDCCGVLHWGNCIMAKVTLVVACVVMLTPAAVGEDIMDLFARLIRTYGYNCPRIIGADILGTDQYGKVAKMTCEGG